MTYKKYTAYTHKIATTMYIHVVSWYKITTDTLHQILTCPCHVSHEWHDASLLTLTCGGICLVNLLVSTRCPSFCVDPCHVTLTVTLISIHVDVDQVAVI